MNDGYKLVPSPVPLPTYRGRNVVPDLRLKGELVVYVRIPRVDETTERPGYRRGLPLVGEEERLARSQWDGENCEPSHV